MERRGKSSPVRMVTYVRCKPYPKQHPMGRRSDICPGVAREFSPEASWRQGAKIDDRLRQNPAYRRSCTKKRGKNTWSRSELIASKRKWSRTVAQERFGIITNEYNCVERPRGMAPKGITVRKVRASQGRIADNVSHRRLSGKCNRNKPPRLFWKAQNCDGLFDMQSFYVTRVV